MEIFLIKLLQFMLAISILVLLHEGGHFFFSKLFGVRECILYGQTHVGNTQLCLDRTVAELYCTVNY